MPNYASVQSGSVFHLNNERAIANRVYEANNGRFDSLNSFVDCFLLHEVVAPISFSQGKYQLTIPQLTHTHTVGSTDDLESVKTGHGIGWESALELCKVNGPSRYLPLI